jgi:hypothetical protein
LDGLFRPETTCRGHPLDPGTRAACGRFAGFGELLKRQRRGTCVSVEYRARTKRRAKPTPGEAPSEALDVTAWGSRNYPLQNDSLGAADGAPQQADHIAEVVAEFEAWDNRIELCQENGKPRGVVVWNPIEPIGQESTEMWTRYRALDQRALAAYLLSSGRVNGRIKTA